MGCLLFKIDLCATRIFDFVHLRRNRAACGNIVQLEGRGKVVQVWLDKLAIRACYGMAIGAYLVRIFVMGMLVGRYGPKASLGPPDPLLQFFVQSIQLVLRGRIHRLQPLT